LCSDIDELRTKNDIYEERDIVLDKYKITNRKKINDRGIIIWNEVILLVEKYQFNNFFNLALKISQ